jgi:hypothetical protein
VGIFVGYMAQQGSIKAIGVGVIALLAAGGAALLSGVIFAFAY